MDTAQLLDAAADELELRGHRKQYVGDPDTPKCILGAISFASCGDTHHLWDIEVQEASRKVVAYLGLRVLHTGPIPFDNSHQQLLADWNNRDEREPFEVIDACRHTAKALREVGD